MDTNPNDNTQIQTPPIPVNPTPVPQGGGAVTAPVVQQPHSVTPGGKESAPIPTQPGEVRDFIEPASHEASPQLPQEVERAGVEVSPQPAVALNKEQQAVGIQAAKESAPLPTDSQGVVSSPWPIAKAEKEAGGDAGNSSTWLGKLVLFVFGQQQHSKDTV